MLIVIEGLDGAGKSTQVKLVKSFLSQLPNPLRYIHYPRYESDVYGPLISEFLRGEFGDNQTVHPKLVALLYAEDRHAAVPQMNAALKNNGNLLLDRYVYSNIAYQCAKIDSKEQQEQLRDWIFETEYEKFHLPRPDLNIFLDVPIGFVEKKLKSARNGEDRDYLEGSKDIHEADINFQKRVREVYLQQCELDSKFIRIDCSDQNGEMLDPDTIFSKIKAELENIFQN